MQQGSCCRFCCSFRGQHFSNTPSLPYHLQEKEYNSSGNHRARRSKTPGDSLEVTQNAKPILENSPEAIRYRRNLNTLSILGIGVIIFGFWGIIKLASELFLGIAIYRPEDVEGFSDFEIKIVNITIFVVMTVDIILRIIVGLKAKREEHGKKTGRGYLMIILMLVVSSSLNVTAVAWEILNMHGAFGENFVAIFMELSSLVVSLEVFIAAVSVRRYRRKYLVGRRT